MKLKTLEVNPHVRYRLPRKRWQSGAMALVWAALAVWTVTDPFGPWWVIGFFLGMDAMFFLGNVYAFVMYDELVKQHAAAEKARQEMQARWNAPLNLRKDEEN
ncbi:hypothetical protein SEA_LAZERLEMON_50 [Streptomyces phage LazerLemon]|nr:hypothetical protein SEA_LAZERLEMON_50 [Streptomyces phage LazerLemon]